MSVGRLSSEVLSLAAVWVRKCAFKEPREFNSTASHGAASRPDAPGRCEAFPSDFAWPLLYFFPLPELQLLVRL